MEQLTIICVLVIAISTTTQCLRIRLNEEAPLVRTEYDYDNYKQDIRRERRSSITKYRKNCNSWSTWIDKDNVPPMGGNETESASPQFLEDFCPKASVGNVTAIRCKYTTNAEPFHGDLIHENFNIYCSDVVHGMVCVPKKERCPDMAIQYYCSCPTEPTTTTTTVTIPTTKVTTTITEQSDTAEPTTEFTTTITEQPDTAKPTTEFTTTITEQPDTAEPTTEFTTTITEQSDTAEPTTEFTTTITEQPHTAEPTTEFTTTITEQSDTAEPTTEFTTTTTEQPHTVLPSTEATTTTTEHPDKITQTTEFTTTTTEYPYPEKTTQTTGFTTVKGYPDTAIPIRVVIQTTNVNPDTTTRTTGVTTTTNGDLNNEVPSKDMEKESGFPWWIPVAAGTCLLIVVIATTSVCVYKHKRKIRPAGKLETQIHPLVDV